MSLWLVVQGNKYLKYFTVTHTTYGGYRVRHTFNGDNFLSKKYINKNEFLTFLNVSLFGLHIQTNKYAFTSI